MFGGYTGKLLRVDLTQKTHTVETIPEELIKKYIGGKGISARLLYDELPAACDPLGSDNLLVFANGPLTGTLAPASSRVTVSTKSPLTGGWLDSNCGGFWGPELKYAGYDVLMIKGRAAEPCVLVIEDSSIKFDSASEFQGFDCACTEEALKEKYGIDYRIACIGPAGEKNSPLAAIIAEGRAFGRGGPGAVMGSKNLKAIAVRGHGSIAIAQYEPFLSANKEALNEISINPDTGGSRPKYGTNSILSAMDMLGIHPVKNFQGVPWDGAPQLNEDVLADEYYNKHKACFACPIRCSKVSRVDAGKYRGSVVEGPEYENAWGFGAQCGNPDPGAVIEAERLCDLYGLDSVSTGNAVGFAMECYERGLITEQQVGFALKFGDDEAMIKLIHLMGKGEGFGKVIGQGVKRAAEIIGGNSADFAMHVKGMELPAYDPRAVFGMGLAYATSDRGGCHLRAWPVGAEVLQTKGRLDPFSTEYKADLVKSQQEWFAIIDSIGMCLFATFALTPRQVTALLNTLTGIQQFESADYLVTAGERIYNLTRLFNIREGFGKKDDTLPSRLLNEPMPSGPAKGNTVDLEPMLKEYYYIRGWDEEGIPKEETLASLGLKK
ncbi:aldehyde ferredoxin oxidoreductase family protein [Sporomusa sp.]|uniref:aldehyde ferredoxin oxidoreductase family protein n=1 Tax=Sporomusa sp. TaxID=2078658 RepID=UPI002B914F25|nr:aldehyde ferredoxin oxidoreductase family protein [Sporomusa sp.]HWR45690.1 aldehyde ferredoxin oxidoreductase family protein [Sporomusa sp.]